MKSMPEPELESRAGGASGLTRFLPRRACQFAAIVVLILTGCSAREIYDASAGWRRNECNKIGDQDKRERCLKEEADRSYDDYRGGAASRVSR